MNFSSAATNRYIDRVNLVALILFLLAIGCGAFAWWGMFTAAGQRRFDEMAGMIPFFVAIAAGVLTVAAGILSIIAYVRR